MNNVLRVEGVSRPIQAVTTHNNAVEKPKQGFASFLKQAIEKVNQSQLEADQYTQQLITGEIDDLHQVMLAAEKANLELQLAVQVRNKVIEAYQEIMRMQM